MEKIDNSMFDFLNRESRKQVINPGVDKSNRGDGLLTTLEDIRQYQEVHVKDYISPL